MSGMKTCTKCGIEKPLSEYHRRRNRPIQLVSKCKECVNAYSRFHIAKRRKDPDWKEWRPTPELNRKYQLKFQYGITPAIYDQMLIEQEYTCAGCKKDVEKPVIDHDKYTGKICGLLCTQCNNAAGLMDHNSTMILNLAEYIKRTRESG